MTELKGTRILVVNRRRESHFIKNGGGNGAKLQAMEGMNWRNTALGEKIKTSGIIQNLLNTHSPSFDKISEFGTSYWFLDILYDIE